MQIILRCAHCGAIEESSTDLVCARCGEVGWRAPVDPIPPVTDSEIRSMAKLCAWGMTGTARREVLIQNTRLSGSVGRAIKALFGGR